MNWWRRIASRIRALVRRQQFEDELDEELRFHLQMQTEDLERRGMTPQEAQRAARNSFGGVEQVKEECRRVGGVAWFESVWQDVRFGLRMLRKSPGFTAAAVLTLAIGIGANTAIFSVIHAVLLRPLPFHDPAELVTLRAVNRQQDLRNEGLSLPDFQDVRRESQSFSSVAAYSWSDIDLVVEDRTERLEGLRVTPEYFALLGLNVSPGAAFTADEQKTGQHVMVLSRDQWRRRFKSDPGIADQTLDVNTWEAYPGPAVTTYVIAGVMTEDVPFLPAQTDFDARAVGVNDRVQFWLPLPEQESETRHKGTNLNVIARLRPEVTIDDARSEMAVLSARLEAEYPETNRDWSIEPVLLHDVVVKEIRPALVMLFGAVGSVLLIACANVANLLLARNVARRSEIAVRAALGAHGGRIARQLLTECLLLALLGGALGIVLAQGTIKALLMLVPDDVPRLSHVGIDGAVLLFTLGVAVFTGVLSGLAPVLSTIRPDLNESLKTQQRGRSPSVASRRALGSLIVTQVALTLALLVGAGLMIRSFANVARVDPGFDSENLLTMTLSLPEARFEWKHNTVFCNQVVDRVRALPGVRAAGASRGVPTRETSFEVSVAIEGRPPAPLTDLPRVSIRVVNTSYFETMRIPLHAGRLFRPEDEIGEIGIARSIIISQTMAHRFWPGEDAVGKRLRIISTTDELPWSEVVGVIGDVTYSGLDHAATSDMYYPDALFPQTHMTLLVRTEIDPSTLIPAIRSEIAAVEPTALILDVQTMQQVIAKSLGQRRFATIVLAAFAGVALLLALVGIYGVISYAVSQRTREIGIRMALGAAPADVLNQFLRSGLGLSLAGTALGLAVSFAATRLLRSQLYGIDPLDLPTLAAASLLLIAVGVAASYVPARRAVRSDPVQALREE